MFWSGCWKELDRWGGKREKIFKKRKEKEKKENVWKKWIQWNRIKWNDGSKIEFENFTKNKKYSRKKLKKNIFNKNWK